MDVQLKELLEKINNDGVKIAEENARRIIHDAENKAAAIIAKARDDSESLKKTAKADSEKAERSGKEALRQAGRDLIITVKAEIESLFSKVLEAETGAVLDGSLLSEAVASAVAKLAVSDTSGLDVLVPENKLKDLKAGLIAKLGTRMSAGLEIKPFKNLDAGFRIAKKDGTAFYDFSDKEIAAMLGRFLNPRLTELLSD
jgi:V/A-type H+-transporting ATPase subunit E